MAGLRWGRFLRHPGFADRQVADRRDRRQQRVGIPHPGVIAEARDRASFVVRCAAKDGNFNLRAHAPGLPANPSFFQGTAGIGYMLLRLAEPERLPCALLWE